MVVFSYLGIYCTFLSTQVESKLVSALFGVTAFSSIWSILEVIKQEKRVAKGWFPRNPKKDKKTINGEKK